MPRSILTTTNKMKQWDTCASNCIISEAGGKMTDISGNELSYTIHEIRDIMKMEFW